MELVVDGVMLRTGKPYTPIGKIPVWLMWCLPLTWRRL